VRGRRSAALHLHPDAELQRRAPRSFPHGDQSVGVVDVDSFRTLVRSGPCRNGS
jgi:hypothetical protein